MSQPPNKKDQALAPKPVASDPELIKQFLDLQGKEIGVKLEEVVLRRQEQANSHEYAKKALDAQVEDLDRERKHRHQIQRERLIFASLVLLVFGSFVIVALIYNKESIAQQIIQALLFLLAGGLGGYSLGKNRSHQKRDNQDDSST